LRRRLDGGRQRFGWGTTGGGLGRRGVELAEGRLHAEAGFAGDLRRIENRTDRLRSADNRAAEVAEDAGSGDCRLDGLIERHVPPFVRLLRGGTVVNRAGLGSEGVFAGRRVKLRVLDRFGNLLVMGKLGVVVSVRTNQIAAHCYQQSGSESRRNG
jgi:hypothetical protein